MAIVQILLKRIAVIHSYLKANLRSNAARVKLSSRLGAGFFPWHGLDGYSDHLPKFARLGESWR